MELLQAEKRTFKYDHPDYNVRMVYPYESHEIVPENQSYLVVIAIEEGCSLSSGSKKIVLKGGSSMLLRLDSSAVSITSKHANSRCLTLLYRDSYVQQMDIAEQDITAINEAIINAGKISDDISRIAYVKATDFLRMSVSSLLLPAFYKSKSLFILSTLMDAVQPKMSPNKLELRESDVEKISQVKLLIENNLQETYTIHQLAKEVGTNVQYLKQHFKSYYGLTIFNFVLKCKMQRAQHLLKDRRLTISFIGNQLGYKHASHFTAAFKKFFGYVPNSLRYVLLMIYDELVATLEMVLV
jgi:AraC-like DNA-binding protein